MTFLTVHVMLGILVHWVHLVQHVPLENIKTQLVQQNVRHVRSTKRRPRHRCPLMRVCAWLDMHFNKIIACCVKLESTKPPTPTLPATAPVLLILRAQKAVTR